MAAIWSGFVPASMIEETKAANSGGAQPLSSESSVWMKTSPLKGCFSRSTGLYM